MLGIVPTSAPATHSRPGHSHTTWRERSDLGNKLTALYSWGSGNRWVDIVDNVGTRPESVVNRRGKVVRGSCETG